MKEFTKNHRLYSNIGERLKYKESLQIYPNCHWGQRKLLFSELEFLTKVSFHLNLDECVVVYVGAARGTHISILASLFPNVRFIFFLS